jgi:hypothetical protein
LLALIIVNGAGVDRMDRPPIEDLSVQRVALPTEHEFVLSLRNGGPEPVTLSQVVVNDAIWDFEAEPDSTIPRLGSATVTIPYSWVVGEAYEIVLITSTGTTFDAEVPVAVLTPQFSGETFFRYALIGTYVGVIPVALGLLWYPFLRRLGSSGMNFVLALTVGLLAFLVIDTLAEAMEVAVELPGVFSGIPLVILLTLLTLLKCQQHLGYLPALTEVPEQIRTYLCQQLNLLPLMYTHVEAEKTLYRYRQMIRTFLEIKPYGDGGQDVVETAVQHAAYTMSDPADLINLAVEHLIRFCQN